MTFDVLLFAGVRDAASSDRVRITVEVPVMASALINLIADRIPAAAALIHVSRLAVDGQYVASDRMIDSADAELALIPPVSGG